MTGSFCEDCGARLSVGIKYCEDCGAEIEPAGDLGQQHEGLDAQFGGTSRGSSFPSYSRLTSNGPGEIAPRSAVPSITASLMYHAQAISLLLVGALYIATFLAYRFAGHTRHPVFLSLLFLPLYISWAGGLLTPRWVSYPIKRYEDWMVQGRSKVNALQSIWGKWIVRPIMTILIIPVLIFKPLSFRIGLFIKPAAYLYGLAISLFVIYELVFMAIALAIGVIVIAIFLAFLLLALWIWSLTSSGPPFSPPATNPNASPLRSAAGSSRSREGLWGPYTEHSDSMGNVTGESRRRQGLFEEYAEHTNVNGQVIGTSHQVNGLFEPYTEHRDTSGNKVGESREQQGIFGSYVEHRDEQGKVVGESRENEDLWGPFTDHQPKQ